MQLIKFLFLLSLIGCMFLSSSAADSCGSYESSSGDFCYTVSPNNTVAIIRFEGELDNFPGLTFVVIPSTIAGMPVVEIGYSAFYESDYLSNFLGGVTIPDSVKVIDDDAFYHCTKFTGVGIPNSVMSIGDEAFGSCTGLYSVTIGSGVTSILDSAFKGCTNLHSAYFLGNAPSSMGIDVFMDSASDFTVYYTAGATGFTNPWRGYPTAVVGPTTTTTTSSVSTTTTTVCPLIKLLGEDNPQLENLRDFRDSSLANTALGRKVIQIYYTNSDSINAALDRSPVLRAVTRRVLEVIAPMMGKN